MSLFYHYLTDDLAQFKALLKQEKEATRPRHGKQKTGKLDLNEVDYLGRTVLHLAASDGKYDFVEALLEHHQLDLEKGDRESGWSALHRALYAGKVTLARLLLEHKNLRNSSRDLLSCTDLESNTAFDVYNSTVPGVNPLIFTEQRGGSDLFTFGSNANHTLGFSDADDRSFPERVTLKRVERDPSNSNFFKTQRIKDVVMAKYHTIVLTTDSVNNIFACGFAKNGRLGLSGGTQFTLQPILIPGQVVAVAASQEHSLAVTKSGDLYAWGSNTNGQLGVELEGNLSYCSLPRKVYRLAKESVIGVATSNTHSVCFTSSALYTWGFNDGALGYEVNPQEGKVVMQPRKVTSLSTAVKQVAATRHATTCLLESDDIVVFTNYGFFKLSLQLDRFASQYQVFRPRQAYSPSKVVKVVSGSASIAVMTSMGDVFSFVLDESTATTKPASLAKSIKPNRVWSLRKKHMAIRDVAIGQEGTIVMCTESGLVYTGTRKNMKKTDSIKSDYKFSKVFGITRVVQVRASESGAFALIRDDLQLRPITPDATNLAEDLLCTLPYSSLILDEDEIELTNDRDDAHDADSEADEVVPKHVSNACDLLRSKNFSTDWDVSEGTHDLVLECSGQSLLAHKAICCARSPVFKDIIVTSADVEGIHKSIRDGASIVINLDKFTDDPRSVLIVLHWMYTDILLTPWTGCASKDQRALLMLKESARKLAEKLQLKALAKALSGSFLIAPKATLATDMTLIQKQAEHSGTADMRLLLQDGHVLTHSAVLAARSEFFGAMITGAWISSRRDNSAEAIVEINVQHIPMRIMRIVLNHIYGDLDSDVFEDVDVSDMEDYLDLVISVMATSAELLLNRLMQACQSVLARYIHRKNVVIILQEADRYAAEDLKEGCLDYCAKNLQFLMEKNLLDGLSEALMFDLELYIARKQLERLPISKSGVLLSQLIQRNPDVLEESEIVKQKYLTSLLEAKPTTLSSTDRPGLSTDVSSQNSVRTPLPAQKTPVQTIQHTSLLDDIAAFDLADMGRALPVKVQQTEDKPAAARTNAESSRAGHELLQAPAPPVTTSSSAAVSSAATPGSGSRGWQAPKNPTGPVTDLRSALTESLMATTPKRTHDQPWTAVSNGKSSQKERKKQSAGTPKAPLEVPSTPTPTSSPAVPWALKKEVPVTPLMSISTSQKTTVHHAVDRSPTIAPVMQVPKSSRRPSATPQASSLSRGNGSYSGSFQGLSASPGPSSVGRSLGEIMAAEEAAKTKMVEYNAKRSMKEIQEQEAFELWFQEESRRVQREAEATARETQSTDSGANKGARKRSTKSKPKPKAKQDKAVDAQSAMNALPHTGPGGQVFRSNPEAAEFTPKFKIER